jgi:hypothetical protein
VRGKRDSSRTGEDKASPLEDFVRSVNRVRVRSLDDLGSATRTFQVARVLALSFRRKCKVNPDRLADLVSTYLSIACNASRLLATFGRTRQWLAAVLSGDRLRVLRSWVAVSRGRLTRLPNSEIGVFVHPARGAGLGDRALACRPTDCQLHDRDLALVTCSARQSCVRYRMRYSVR